MANSSSSLTLGAIGMDLGDRYSDLCALLPSGDLAFEKRLPMRPQSLRTFFSKKPPTKVVMEVGGHSRWVSALLSELGYDAFVADARRVGMIARAGSKTDKKDARLLALLGLGDAGLLTRIHHRSESAQADLAILKSRDTLIGNRTQLVNRIRALVKTTGSRLPRVDAEAFHRRAYELIPEIVRPACDPLFKQLRCIAESIKELDKQIEELCKKYPETELFRSIQGVGPITSLSFALTIEDPTRFAKSRDVGAYLGLAPRQRESGKAKPQLGITKAGNPFMRRLLIQAAQYFLGKLNKVDSDLRRWGLDYFQRGGKNAKKRAVAATARKLAVLLHRLWITGEKFRPLRNKEGDSDKTCQPAN